MLRLVLLAVLGVPVAAQRIEWRLPERSAAVYRTRIEQTGRARGVSAPDTWAPMLLEGELARDRRHLSRAPDDFLDLVPYLAFDLREANGGRIRLDLPAAGVAASVRADYERPGEATQTVLVQLSAGAQHGTLRVDRSFDQELGVVDHFRARLELGDWRRTEEWTFDRVEQADTPRFRADVGVAIDAGIANLLSHLGRSPGRLADRYQPGQLALILFTLFKAGQGTSDARIARAWEDLKEREITQTYDLACAILAMEALHTPQDERDRILRGDLDGPQQRALSPEDLAVLQRWTERLLENGDHRVDVAYRRRWRYTRNDGYDNSNTQYALLGLYAAELCGAQISRTVWFAAIEHELDELQDVDGLPHRLDVTTHRDLERNRRSPNRTVTVTRAYPPGAWGYVGRSTPTGSMTAAGIASLTICESSLMREGSMPIELRQSVREARTRGLIWLSERLTARTNPGDARSSSMRHFYYLYSLERACEFLQIAYLDGRDWYFEGAMQLLLCREPGSSGGWSRPTETCFAVLFLKKAAYGPITGQR